MHDFNYRKDELYCEKVRVRDILKKVGTPAYIYSHATIVGHLRKIQKAFASVKPLICYSMKANSNLAILKTVISTGAGLDIVSAGELYRAKKAGCDPKKMVFAGVGKTEEEISQAIRFGILLFNVESAPELERIDTVARSLNRKVKVSLRVNPGVDPHTHHHIATGKAESKFGMDPATAKKLFLNRKNYFGVNLCAVHVHIGSQIVIGDPFVEAFEKVLGFVDDLEASGVCIEFLNLGGGLGVIYNEENPQTAEQFAKRILPLFKGRKFRLIFEPGRFVVANAGILASEVIYIKETNVKKFAIINAAMNDLIRPSLYGAYHGVWPLTRHEDRPKVKYDVVGPICESGDVLAKDREIERLSSGDLIALMSAGAYGFVMSSNYNSRPKVCEVMVKGSQFSVIRKRENFATLTAGEKIPAFV